MFWKEGEEHDTREWCCNIWYWVQLYHGGSIPNGAPESDKKTCKKFQQGVGFPGTCYDCVYWASEDLLETRENGCSAWSRVMADDSKLKRKVREQFGANVSFDMFHSEVPYVDEQTCFDFELDKKLEAGHGQACVKKAKDLAAQGNAPEEKAILATSSDLPADTYYVTDELLDAVSKPENEVLGRLRKLKRKKK